MATIRLEVVTPEKMVLSNDVDMILDRGVEVEVVHPRSSFRDVIIDGQTTCHGVTAGRRDNLW